MTTLIPNESILGYKLIERIGSGGYGEVWSAEAPGGISKAIKFVYGFHDQERAATELRSLDRIKSVRHPFLLSLEQIQIHDEKLIVVTELADKSLADLFGEYQNAGQPGIPRDEMLDYMRDAADGLDYLSQAHNLQHLDVKPENLLLLGRHIKIADFGLVKDLNCVTQSMMSGLTPVYAPPEIFDGRPHSNSDQYSLAIVYAEMLTGTRPFSGTTPAQLAAQHINSRPALQSLPSGDQAVIARALSKDPALRYPNCRAMVDELTERKSRTQVKKKQGSTVRRDASDNTFVVNRLTTPEMTAIVSNTNLPVQAAQVGYLECLESFDESACIGPTLVIGVGRFGCKVIQHFRERVEHRFGPMARVPCLGLLAIDTDRQFLATLVDTDWFGGLDLGQTLPIQLKTSEQYRVQKKLRLDWISRRWIYNIPRSGQTEGLRPLGRLAFADHFETVFRRLKDMTTELIKPENVALSAETTGLEPRPQAIRVFVAGAASGGVGSGTLIDLAYAIRTLFSELGRHEIELMGMLAHWTPRESDQQLLAIANSLSLLNEIRHVNRFGYPGDVSLGLPELDDPVFDHTYLQHLGDALSPIGLHVAARANAQYLFLNTLSDCKVFFESCRHGRGSNEIRSAHVKSFGLCQPELFERSLQNLAGGLGQRWIEPVSEPFPEPLQAEWERLVVDKGLCADGLRAACRTECDRLVQTEWSRIDEFRRAAEPDWRTAETEARFDQLMDALRSSGGEPSSVPHESHSREPKLVEGSQAAVDARGAALGEQLIAELTSRISQPDFRVNGAKALVTKLTQTLRGIVQAMQDDQRTLELRAREQELGFRAARGNKRTPSTTVEDAFDQWSQAYLNGRRAHWTATLTKSLLTPVIARLLQAETQFMGWQGVLRQWIPAPQPTLGESTIPNQIPSTQIYWKLEARMAELVSRLDANLQHGWLHLVGGLDNVLKDPAGLGCQFERQVMIAAADTLAAAENELSLEDVVVHGGLTLESVREVLGQELSSAFPRLTECGGEIRALIGYAGESFRSKDEAVQFFNYQSPKPTLIRHRHGDLVLCQELQSVPLANLVFRLMELRTDAVDLVGRIHTRNDIDWTDLNELFLQANSTTSR